MIILTFLRARAGPNDPFLFTGVGTVLQDLHVLDLGTMAWQDLTASMTGDVPAASVYFGFAVLGGKLYLFGGAANFSGTRPTFLKERFCANFGSATLALSLSEKFLCHARVVAQV